MSSCSAFTIVNDAPFAWISDELQTLDAEGLRRVRRTVRPLPDGRCEVDGRVLWNCAGNDYLNLAADPRVLDAARLAILESGVGARASQLICGRTEWHERLESRLAEFEGEEAALLFPSGYAANVGTIGALVEAGDVVLCDRLNHASLVEGCRVSGARFKVYPHCDVDRLDRELSRCQEFRRRLIVTDGVFSMDGDVAPLKELADVADRRHAMLLVDEAHATGVFGANGRGMCELAGVEDQGIVRVGTLSKAVGAQGGFVAGPRELVEWLWNRARTQIYSTALAIPACAAADAALRVIQAEPGRRTKLVENSRTFYEMLKSHTSPGHGPIVPIVVGDADSTMHAARTLEQHGFLVGSIRPPTVPRGTARLRISLTAAHHESMLRELAMRAIELSECDDSSPLERP